MHINKPYAGDHFRTFAHKFKGPSPKSILQPANIQEFNNSTGKRHTRNSVFQMDLKEKDKDMG